jgi:hypothetical protein
MATIGGTVLTLADVAKRTDSTGKIGKIVEILEQTNPILEDMMWKEANEVTGHTSTIRTGLPAVYWRMINQGLPPSKSTTAQAREAAGMLEAWSETDVKLVELSGDPGALRLSESRAFLEAMSQEMAQTLFYGNAYINAEEFTGLAPRYSSLSAGNGGNILDAQGTDSADNTSIWVITWGENTVHGFYPKGSSAGVKHQDLGEVTVETTAGVAGNRMRAYQDHFEWDAGLVVQDWRYVVRIANIDMSALVANSSPADLVVWLSRAYHMIPNKNAGRTVIYMNRTVFSRFDVQRREDVAAGGGLTYSNVDGMAIPDFRGIPIKLTDAILETEGRVT